MRLEKYNSSSFLIDNESYQRGGYRFDFKPDNSELALWDKDKKTYIKGGFRPFSDWEDDLGNPFTDREGFEVYYRDFFFELGSGVVPDSSIGFDKLQDIQSQRLVGRYDPGDGQLQEIQIGATLQLIGDTLETNIDINGWDGEVNTRNDLPIAVGDPAIGTIYIVLNPITETVLGVPYKTYQSGLYLRSANTGALTDWERLNVKTQFVDSEFKVADFDDTSRQIMFDVSQVTSGNVRTLIFQDKNYTVAGVDDITVTNATNIGAGANIFKQIVSKVLELRTIIGDSRIGVVENADTIQITFSPQSGDYSHSQITLDDGTNPHGTTKADVGLGNVDNTSDADKPISTATQTALDAKKNDFVASNGLTEGVGTLKLGGTLTENTTIEGVFSRNLALGTNTSPLFGFNVYSDGFSGITLTADDLGTISTLTITESSIKLYSDNLIDLDASNTVLITSPLIANLINESLPSWLNVLDEADARDIDNRNRANHTGQQLASTISDFDAEVSNNTDVTTNTAKVSFPEAPLDSQEYVRFNGTWVLNTGGSGGESNTASNQGVGGVGVFIQKTGIDLEFKNINSTSNLLTVTDDVANNEIDLTVNQANLSITASQVSDFDTEVSNNTDVTNNTAKVSFPEAPNDGQQYARQSLGWAVVSSLSPLTTKGDLYTYDTGDQRLGVGSDGSVLVADSTESTGLKWETPTEHVYNTSLLSANWVLDADDIYYQDIPHNLNTDDIGIEVYDSTSKETIIVEKLERTTTNNLRLFVKGNTLNLNVVIWDAIFGVQNVRRTVVKNPVSPYTPNNGDIIVWDTTSGNKVVSLPPSASSNNFAFDVKKTDATANTITVDPNSTELIEGGTTAVITTQYEAISSVCDGTEWWVIAAI
jgi:hypothetical protein